MDLFSREDLKRLAQATDGPCISLYMPTIRYESDQSQNHIRYKNLLRDVRNQLNSTALRDDEIEELLEPATKKLDATSFWRSMTNGLAVFIAPSGTQFYRLPLEFDEVAVVGKQFHLKPLFPLIATNNRYYVLALSLNDVRLYQGTHYALTEVSTADIPSSLVEAVVQYEDSEKQLQHHTSKRTMSGRRDTSYHGHGVSADDSSAQPKDELRRFFRVIDERLRVYLADENAPLVLASVKEYLPYYVEVNRYPHLIEDDVVAGNPERLHVTELHEKTWAVVHPIFRESQEKAIKQFNHLYHSSDTLASGDFHEIVPAAAYSRVDTLFVPVGHHRWGTYDLTNNTVELHNDQEPGDDDLLNFAAVHAYLNGATVHALRPENMPNGMSLAATFRFAADVSAEETGS